MHVLRGCKHFTSESPSRKIYRSLQSHHLCDVSYLIVNALCENGGDYLRLAFDTLSNQTHFLHSGTLLAEMREIYECRWYVHYAIYQRSSDAFIRSTLLACYFFCYYIIINTYIRGMCCSRGRFIVKHINFYRVILLARCGRWIGKMRYNICFTQGTTPTISTTSKRLDHGVAFFVKWEFTYHKNVYTWHFFLSFCFPHEKETRWTLITYSYLHHRMRS